MSVNDKLILMTPGTLVQRSEHPAHSRRGDGSNPSRPIIDCKERW